MKLVSFVCDGGPPRVGVLEDSGEVLDLSRVTSAGSPGEVLIGGDIEFAKLREAVALGIADRFSADAVSFGAPVLPGKIVAIGRNYADHAKEGGHLVPDEPILFGKCSTCVVGPGEAIQIPSGVGRVDHELELAVVIGRRAKAIDREDAEGIVAGYTVLNDVTAREMQRADAKLGRPWFRAKNLDTFAPMGPVLVTRDELGFPPKVRMRLFVNGELRQSGSTEEMVFDIPALLAYVTKWVTLCPGDVLATGTPSGVGPLVPGDTVRAEIDGIGVLENPISGVCGAGSSRRVG